MIFVVYTFWRIFSSFFTILNLFDCFYVKVENYWNFTKSKIYYNSTFLYRRKSRCDNKFFQDLPKDFFHQLSFKIWGAQEKKTVFRNLWLYSILSSHILFLSNNIFQFGLCVTQTFLDTKSKFCFMFAALKRNSEYCKNCF